jgi:hypothetical protein
MSPPSAPADATRPSNAAGAGDPGAFAEMFAALSGVEGGGANQPAATTPACSGPAPVRFAPLAATAALPSNPSAEQLLARAQPLAPALAGEAANPPVSDESETAAAPDGDPAAPPAPAPIVIDVASAPVARAAPTAAIADPTGAPGGFAPAASAIGGLDKMPAPLTAIGAFAGPIAPSRASGPETVLPPGEALPFQQGGAPAAAGPPPSLLTAFGTTAGERALDTPPRGATSRTDTAHLIGPNAAEPLPADAGAGPPAAPFAGSDLARAVTAGPGVAAAPPAEQTTDDALVASTPSPSRPLGGAFAAPAAAVDASSALRARETIASDARPSGGRVDASGLTGGATNAPSFVIPPATLNQAQAAGGATLAAPVFAAAQSHGESVKVDGIAVEIAARMREGKRRFEIRLDPPELGRIDVRLDVARDGQVTSRLVVERADTLDLLRRDSGSLERALQGAGLRADDGGLQFSLRDHSGNPWAQRDEVPRPNLLILPDEDVAVRDAVQRAYNVLRGVGRGVDISI